MTQHEIYAKFVAAWRYAQHTVYRSHISLYKYQATAVQKLLCLSVAAHGIVSHPMECYDTGSSILPCCIVGRCFAAPVGGSGVMDAEKLKGCQKRAATIWAFWDRVTVHLQVWWQEQRQCVVRVHEGFPLKGERGTSVQRRWLLSSCLLCTLPYKGCNTPPGLFNSRIPKTAPEHIAILHTHAHTQADADTYKHLPPWTSTCMHTHTHSLQLVPSLSLCDPWWRSSGVVGSSSLTFRIVCVWVSVKPSNYRQPLHIHWWPDWLGIPHGTTPKPLTHISNANAGRCREMDSWYTPPTPPPPPNFFSHIHTYAHASSGTDCHLPNDEVNNYVMSGF